MTASWLNGSSIAAALAWEIVIKSTKNCLKKIQLTSSNSASQQGKSNSLNGNVKVEM